MSNGQNQNQIDYELRIDTQTEKLLDMNQKFTYFLITGSVAIIAFLASFISEHQNEVKGLVLLAIISSIFGLLTSFFSLLNLHFELKSYKLHIHYRYKKKNVDELSNKEINEWDSLNSSKNKCLNSAFLFLFLEISFATIFLFYFFIKYN